MVTLYFDLPDISPEVPPPDGLLRWIRYQSPEGSFWWWSEADGKWFVESEDQNGSQSEDGDWTKYLTHDLREWWYKSDNEWFYVDSGRKSDRSKEFDGRPSQAMQL